MRKDTTLRIGGRTFLLGPRTWIMGVVNVTPDSFSDGGSFLDPAAAVARGLALAEDGADIIDVGGESSRPGSEPVPVGEEIRRVLPVVAGLRKKTPVPISVDTTKSEVASAALDAGADIVNDISAVSLDPRILVEAGKRGAGLVLMHMRGVPKTMQADTRYGDLLGEIRAFLEERIEIAVGYGLARERLVIDPGIGFGKSSADNLVLINNLEAFSGLGRPVLIGASRKSFIGKILNAPPQDRLEGTIAASIVGVVRGAHILRVHDVRAVRRAVLVADAILSERIEPAREAAEGRYAQ